MMHFVVINRLGWWAAAAAAAEFVFQPVPKQPLFSSTSFGKDLIELQMRYNLHLSFDVVPLLHILGVYCMV